MARLDVLFKFDPIISIRIYEKLDSLSPPALHDVKQSNVKVQIGQSIYNEARHDCCVVTPGYRDKACNAQRMN